MFKPIKSVEAFGLQSIANLSVRLMNVIRIQTMNCVSMCLLCLKTDSWVSGLYNVPASTTSNFPHTTLENPEYSVVSTENMVVNKIK